MTTAGEKIKRIRIMLGYDQAEFAKLLDISKSAVCKYERGGFHPRIKIARKIKNLAKKENIEISIEELIGPS